MSNGNLIEEALTQSIIGAFFEVHNTLGYGFLESVYAMALERELRARGHVVLREFSVHVFYKGEELTFQRLDLVIDGKVVVELKSSQDLHPSAARQVHNYLRATSLEVGLLLHFGPKPRFFRIVCSNSPSKNQRAGGVMPRGENPPFPPNPR